MSDSTDKIYPKYCGECDYAMCYIHDVYCDKTRKVLKKKFLMSNNGLLCYRPMECPLENIVMVFDSSKKIIVKPNTNIHEEDELYKRKYKCIRVDKEKSAFKFRGDDK